MSENKILEEDKKITNKAENEGALVEELEEEEGNPVQELLGEMGDHDQFTFGPIHADILPVIIYDTDGFHFYSSRSSMEESGEYKTEHHSIVNTKTGNHPTLDLSITNMVAFQWISMILLIILFFKTSSSAKKNIKKAPKGLHNMMESVIVFLRDDVVYPNIPGKASDRLLPYFVVLFFFILVMNLFGLIPGGHTATGTLGTTIGLSLTAFLVINFTAIRESGIGAWFKHLLGGAPWWLGFLMVPIEIASLFIKPFALTIRLFANMSAGHIVIFSLIGLIFLFGVYVSIPIILFSTFINLLEVLVAFLQAFIFTMLTAIFVGLAIGEHGHEH